ncbi:unnamed protein product, partial [marine sediment metagenome]
RERARNIVCQSNLKQFGIGNQMYVGDYNGRFTSYEGIGRQENQAALPDVNPDALNGALTWVLVGYAGNEQPHQLGDRGTLWHCPKDMAGVAAQRAVNQEQVSYIWNQHMCWVITMSRIKLPSQYPTMMDGDANTGVRNIRTFSTVNNARLRAGYELHMLRTPPNRWDYRRDSGAKWYVFPPSIFGWEFTGSPDYLFADGHVCWSSAFVRYSMDASDHTLDMLAGIQPGGESIGRPECMK